MIKYEDSELQSTLWSNKSENLTAQRDADGELEIEMTFQSYANSHSDEECTKWLSKEEAW